MFLRFVEFVLSIAWAVGVSLLRREDPAIRDARVANDGRWGDESSGFLEFDFGGVAEGVGRKDSD
jgi:hypothetical protein